MFIELGSLKIAPKLQRSEMFGFARAHCAPPERKSFFNDTGYRHLVALRPGDVALTLETAH